MATTMSKELLIRLPEELYLRAKKVSAGEYKSMSAFIRELLQDRLDEMLSQDDWRDVREARNELRAGKTTSWKAIKRD